MRNAIKVDFYNNTIIITREFAKLASDVRSQEYSMLQKARSNNPEYSVKVRTIKKNPNKETYKGLTYAYMERYIITHETREQATETLTKLAEMYQLAQCRRNGYGYATIKRWFLTRYPDVEKFGVEEAMKRAEEAREKAEATEVEATTTEEKAVA